MLNLVRPRYVLPVHGDHKRIRLHSQLAEAVGIDLDTSSRAATGCRWRSTTTARASASPSSPGMIFVTGSTSAIPPTWRCATADALRRRIFIVVATISESDESPWPTPRDLSGAYRSSEQAGS